MENDGFFMQKTKKSNSSWHFRRSKKLYELDFESTETVRDEIPKRQVSRVDFKIVNRTRHFVLSRVSSYL